MVKDLLRPTIASAPASHVLGHISLLLLALIAFLTLKQLGLFQWSLISLALCCLLVALAWPLRYSVLSRSFALLIRAVAGILGFYALTGYVPLNELYLAAAPDAEPVAVYGRWLAVGCAVGAIVWRPALAWPVLLYIPWQKQLLAEAAGFGLSLTDYYVLVEFGAFLLIGASVAYWLGRMRAFESTLAVAESRAASDPTYWSPTQFISLLAISVHLANYFFSGLMKLRIGDTPWEWVLSNNTHSIMMAAQLAKTLPLTLSEEILARSHELMSWLWMIGNPVLLLGQLFAVIAIKRVSWVIGITIFYDITHVLIFLATGIFFWKWILLNLAIVGSLMAVRSKQISTSLSALLVAFMVVSPLWFFVVWLGWFDTRSLVLTELNAITEDGTVVQVPSNFLLPYSVTMAQQRMGIAHSRDNFPGHFDIGTYGFTHDHRKRRAADSCGLLYDASHDLSHSRWVKGLHPLISAHHKYVVDRVDSRGRFSYDFYPHHIWTNPLEFVSFYSLDKRRIVKYRLVVRSVCFDYLDDAVMAREVHRSSYEFAID